MRTQVAIIGAGPAGLLLGALLHKAGINNIIIERQSADYVLQRIWAGILEQGTVDMLHSIGASAGLQAEGVVHQAIESVFKNAHHSIDVCGLTGGKIVTAYGQIEVTHDLMAARAARGLTTVYSAADVEVIGFDTAQPTVRYVKDSQHIELSCGFIACPSIDKSIAQLRCWVTEPMRFGRLFLAGDAAHIVPPAGAKGLNLAASSVKYLSDAFIDFYANKSTTGVDGYSQRALSRMCKAERFAWPLTSLMHRFPDTNAFGQKTHEVELDCLVRSKAATTALAENYIGLPL